MSGMAIYYQLSSYSAVNSTGAARAVFSRNLRQLSYSATWSMPTRERVGYRVSLESGCQNQRIPTTRRAYHHDIEEWSPHIRNLAPSMPLRILIYYTLERVILMRIPLTEKFSQR